MTGRKRSEGRGYRPITPATLINTRDWMAFAKATSNDVMGNKVEIVNIPIPTTTVDESQLTTAFNGQKVTGQGESPMSYIRAAMNAKGSALVSHAQASSHMSSQNDSQFFTVKHLTAAKTITAKPVNTCSGSSSRSSERSQSPAPRSVSNNTSESLSTWGKGKTARQNKVNELACRDIPASMSFEKYCTSPASNDWSIWGNLNGPSAVGEDALLYWDEKDKMERTAMAAATKEVITQPTADEIERERVQEAGRAIKLKVEEALWDWPWEGAPLKLVTLAPYVINNRHSRSPFALSVANKKHKTCEIFSNGAIMPKIVECIFRDHATASTFAATCQIWWIALRGFMQCWDMNGQNFNNCEKSGLKIRSGSQQGSVAPVIVVTPLRGPDERPSYVKQTVAIYKMLQSVNNFGHFIQNIQFHRVPFLDLHTLGIILPQMTRLKTLGIYSCQLMHVGTTIRLLAILEKDHATHEKSNFSLDFFPLFHLGPRPSQGDPRITGAYGATWDNWNGDTCIAIWGLIRRVLPQAKSQGVDLFGSNKAFRKWLDKSPCLGVEYTLSAIEDGAREDYLAAAVDWRHYGGSVEKFKSEILYRPEGFKWACKYYCCAQCQYYMPGIFFCYGEIIAAIEDDDATFDPYKPRPSSATCLTCHMSQHLDRETDHFKRYKRSAMRHWFRDGEHYNDYSIPNALDDYYTRGIAKLVGNIDEKREEVMTREENPIDKEYDEKQLPWNKYQLQRHGKKNASPTVDEKLEFENQTEEERRWGSTMQRHRYYQHGHAPW